MKNRFVQSYNGSILSVICLKFLIEVNKFLYICMCRCRHTYVQMYTPKLTSHKHVSQAKNQSLVSSCAASDIISRIAYNSPNTGGQTITMEGVQFGGTDMSQAGRVGYTVCEATQWLSG
jgi:hypothetical protein